MKRKVPESKNNPENHRKWEISRVTKNIPRKFDFRHTPPPQKKREKEQGEGEEEGGKNQVTTQRKGPLWVAPGQYPGQTSPEKLEDDPSLNPP